VVSKGLDVVAAEVESTLVLLDYARNQAVPVPDRFRQAIRALEHKPVAGR